MAKTKTDAATGLKIEQRATSDLIPYARNARTHSAEQVAQIAGSIKEFGFNNPVLIDAQGGIIAGHGRVMAAQKLGLEVVPTITLAHLTENQKRAYILADNKLALNAGWDEEMLKAELDALKEASFDLTLAGWDDKELGQILKQDPEGEDAGPQEDKADELAQKWRVESGQLWQLGEHMLLCGDSTKREDVERVMNGGKAGVCFTSPPYGQQRDYKKEGKEKCSDWDSLMCGVFENIPMSDDGQVLVNLGLIHKEGEFVLYWQMWLDWMRSRGWNRFGWYVWDQGFGLPGDWNGRLAPSHEFIFHFNKSVVRPEKVLKKKVENVKVRHHGDSTMRGKDGKVKAFSSPEASAQPNKIPDSVIRINRMSGGHDIAHPAIFPPALPSLVISLWPGIAFEPFSGSGTTIIACEQLKRKCRAIEISPGYVAVAIQRWVDMTGKKPELLK